MKMGSKILGAAALGAMTLTAACVTDPVTGQRRLSNTAIGGIGGALGGYLLGDIIGGRNSRTESLIGAGIGGIAGAAVGSYMDRQERELRERTQGTDVSVVREGDDLILSMPSNVTFSTDSSTIQPQFRSTLDQVSSVLANYENTFVDVYGHTDSVGSEAYNQALSERRASSVADYLSTHGVNSARIAMRGFGETQPVASNETEEGRAAKRRVEIKLVPIQQ